MRCARRTSRSSTRTCNPGVQDRLPYERGQTRLFLHRRRLKVRIHGRPRSDRKKRFLLSAVAPSTSTRHPRKARPINWAQRGGLASGREMPPDAEATFHRASRTLGNQVVAASDGVPFRQDRRPTRVCRTLGACSDLLAMEYMHGAHTVALAPLSVASTSISRQRKTESVTTTVPSAYVVPYWKTRSGVVK